MGDENAKEVFFIAIIIFLLGYVLYDFTEYEIEQQAKYEAQFCPPCKEKERRNGQD